MAEKIKSKRVMVSEQSLVDLIYDIVEKTIKERAEKGEITINTSEPNKTKTVTVTETQLKDLKERGVKLLSVKKVK